MDENTVELPITGYTIEVEMSNTNDECLGVDSEGNVWALDDGLGWYMIYETTEPPVVMSRQEQNPNEDMIIKLVTYGTVALFVLSVLFVLGFILYLLAVVPV